MTERHSFTEDFILGDRRLEERGDIAVTVNWIDDWNGPRIDLLQGGIAFDSKRQRYVLTFASSGAVGTVEVSVKHPLSDRERKLLTILAPLAAYSYSKLKGRPVFGIPRKLGIALGEIRESLSISQRELARQIGANRLTFSTWEAGSHSPGPDTLYKWLNALGLVSPPKTALVRVVDFSPELLRFLQEDPTRLRFLTPDEFERFVANRLDRMGYNVTLTGAANRKDGGIDLIAVPKSANVGSIVIAGQVKHHEGNQTTGREAVDRLLAWKDSRYFGVGLLATNTSFTKDAIWTAHQERNARFLRLRDFMDLKRWLQDQWGTEEDWREIPDKVELAPGVVIEIPRPRITSGLGALQTPFDTVSTSRRRKNRHG